MAPCLGLWTCPCLTFYPFPPFESPLGFLFPLSLDLPPPVKVLAHLGASPFETTPLQEFPNKSHESLVVALVTANFETLIVTNVITLRVGFSKLSQNKGVLHVVIGLIPVLNAGQN